MWGKGKLKPGPPDPAFSGCSVAGSNQANGLKCYSNPCVGGRSSENGTLVLKQHDRRG